MLNQILEKIQNIEEQILQLNLRLNQLEDKINSHINQPTVFTPKSIGDKKPIVFPKLSDEDIQKRERVKQQMKEELIKKKELYNSSNLKN